MSLLSVLLLCKIAFAAQSCFFPNGSPGDHFPCDESAENSACCGGTDACLTNGYCFQQNNASEAWGLRIARGQCTDWNAGEDVCPQLCKDVAVNGTVTVFMVGDFPTALFCCTSHYDPERNQCLEPTQGSSEPFPLPLGQVIYDRKTGATIRLNYEPSPAATNVVTVTATAKSNSDTAAVAAGIAVPLGVLLLCALAAIALLWRRLQRMQRANEDSPQQLQHTADSKSHSPYQDLLSGNNGEAMHVQGYPPIWRQPPMQHSAASVQPPIHELPHVPPQAELGAETPSRSAIDSLNK